MTTRTGQSPSPRQLASMFWWCEVLPVPCPTTASLPVVQPQSKLPLLPWQAFRKQQLQLPLSCHRPTRRLTGKRKSEFALRQWCFLLRSMVSKCSATTNRNAYDVDRYSRSLMCRISALTCKPVQLLSNSRNVLGSSASSLLVRNIDLSN